MVTDEILYSRVQLGDRQALAELVERYHSTLLKFLYRLTGQESIAEDLLQETFIRMLTFRGKAPQQFKPWAFTIACNLSRDRFRSSAYQREIPDGLEEDNAWLPVGDAPDPEDQAVRDADQQFIARVIQRLPPPLREALVLRFFHDLHLEEIAQITGVPLGTAKSRLYRALQQVKLVLLQEEFSL